MLRQLRRRPTPDTRLAEEHDFLIQRGFLEAEAILEVFFGEEKGVGLGGDGEVEGEGDGVGGEFGGLADVD